MASVAASPVIATPSRALSKRQSITLGVLMSLALVYFAEHYVFDVIVGWAYAALAFVVVGAIVERWSHREMPPAVVELERARK